MVWAATSWYYSMGPMITQQGRIADKDYVTTLADHVHTIVQSVFQDDSTLFTLIASSKTSFVCTRMICHQSPALNFILTLRSTLKRKGHDCYRPPPLFPEFSDILQEKMVKMPLKNTQNLYLSISNRLQAVLNAEDFLTPY